MRLHSRLALATLTLAALVVAAPARATPVEARKLATEIDSYVERTVELDDAVARVSTRFSRGEQELGFRKDTHIKLLLIECRLAAFVPKDPSSTALFSQVAEGTPVHLIGRVRKDSVGRREETVMADNADITFYFPDQTVALLEVQKVEVGPYRAPLDRKSYRAVSGPSFSGPGASLDVRVSLKLSQGVSFMRNFTAADKERGATTLNTLKVVDLVPGAVLYLQRTPKNVELLLSLQKGDAIDIEGRLQPAEKSGARVLIADSLRIKG
jgi:hypothetical protein